MLDAKEFLIKQKEMCDSISTSVGCDSCPVYDYCTQGQLQDMVERLSDDDLVNYINAVEQWSKRPKFTNEDKFKEVFNMSLVPSHDHDGYLYLYKGTLGNGINTLLSSEYSLLKWLTEEYKEPTHDEH